MNTCTPWDHSAVIAVPELEELFAAYVRLCSHRSFEGAEEVLRPTVLALDVTGALHHPACGAMCALEEVTETPLEALVLLTSDDVTCECWPASWSGLSGWIEEQRAAAWALVAVESLRTRLASELVHTSLDRQNSRSWEIVLDALELLRELVSIAATTTPELWEEVDVVRRHLRSFVRSLGVSALHTLVVALDAAGLPDPLGAAPPATRLAAVGEGELLEGWNVELTTPVAVMCELDGRASDGLTLAWAVANHRVQQGPRTLLTLPSGLVGYLEGQPGLRVVAADVSTREAEVILSLAAGSALTDLDLDHLVQMAQHVLVMV